MCVCVDGKLQEQVELFRREINRLEYQNDQVSKVSDLERERDNKVISI